jgi:hydrogenase nickel incorporation protein HypB
VTRRCQCSDRSTEGEDKPLKYPTIFNTSDAAIVTKIDLAEAAGFDRAALLANVERVRPGMPVLQLSTRTGAGFPEWLGFLEERRAVQTAAAAIASETARPARPAI